MTDVAGVVLTCVVEVEALRRLVVYAGDVA